MEVIKSEFIEGGEDRHPYGESYAVERYKPHYSGTIEVTDKIDTSEWGDDIPVEIRRELEDTISCWHDIPLVDVVVDCKMTWKLNEEGLVEIDYSN